MHNTARRGEGAIVLAAGTGLHAVCDLLLHHDRDGKNRRMAFKESHDDRRRNVVWEIGHDLHRISVIVGFDELMEIQLQYIIMDDGDIGMIMQGFMENRDEVCIDFHGYHMSGGFCEGLRHGADARADLENAVILRDLGAADDVLQHALIDQKVLAEALLKAEVVFLYDTYGFLRID